MLVIELKIPKQVRDDNNYNMLFKKHFLFIICFFIFLLFLARNPFSSRTLIPNFEPYPDTLHYVIPARNFVVNNQFAIVRESRVMAPRVPPLYSLYLIPFYAVNNDPRFFYFANVFLAVVSFFLFYLIIRKLTTNNQQLSTFILTFFSLFLYITNYFNYWYPTLAMSENLTLFLFLLNFYILTKPINKMSSIVGGFLPFSFFITKYAHAPLTAAFLIAYGIKICMETGWKNKKKLRKWSLFFGGSFLAALFLLLYFELIPNVSAVFRLFTNLLPHQTSVNQTVASSGVWFSTTYMKEHLPNYIRALFGGYSVRFLWDNTPIVPIYIGIPGMIGLVWGIFHKQTRLLSITLVLTLVFTVLFMSTFLTFDMRYLYQAIPTILIGFVIFWGTILSLRGSRRTSADVAIPTRLLHPLSRVHNNKKNVIRYTLYAILLFLFLFYFITNTIRFKKQIMLNLKYAETPWYYLSVIKLNEYFKNYPKEKPVPVVISSLIPYYIDFYSNGNYSLLPLSLLQEFRDNKKEAWGNFNYDDLIKLYYKVLLSGHELFIHNYGLGNEKVLHGDFKKIQDNFILTKVSEGCYGACDIWQVKRKWEIQWIYKK